MFWLGRCRVGAMERVPATSSGKLRSSIRPVLGAFNTYSIPLGEASSAA